MDQKAFEAELSRGGCTQFETKVIEPRPANSAHTHDYIIRGLVLDGIFIVTEGDNHHLSRRRHLSGRGGTTAHTSPFRANAFRRTRAHRVARMMTHISSSPRRRGPITPGAPERRRYRPSCENETTRRMDPRLRGDDATLNRNNSQHGRFCE
jgi:hypothetical protein